MRAPTGGHCTSKGLWCCVQRHALRLSVHSVQLAVSDRETGKRTHFLCQLGTTLFLVLSSDLSQTYESLEISRLACGTHFGSEPNGRLEEPWRSAPCKVWKRVSTKGSLPSYTRHVFRSSRCLRPHLKALQISYSLLNGPRPPDIRLDTGKVDGL